MRRGLLGVAALLLLIILGFIGATVHRNHQLGDKLVEDVAALRAKKFKLARPEGAPFPHVDNGTTCAVSTLSVAPKDLTPFNDGKGDLGAFIRGDKSLSELPEETLSKLETLRPWAKAVRECSDAANLSMVELFEPWNPNDQSTLKMFAAGRISALDTRVQLSAGFPGDALETCTSMMEVALDTSHFSLLHAMGASGVVRMVAPSCSAAWKAADEKVRAQFAPRWVLLGARFASDHDVFDSERVAMSLMIFGYLASDDARAKLPSAVWSAELPRLGRYMLARVWSDWDAAMRQTADATDVASRDAAREAMRSASQRWWLPDDFKSFGPEYNRFAVRMDETRAVLNALAFLATNGKTPLPPEIKMNDGILEIPEPKK